MTFGEKIVFFPLTTGQRVELNSNSFSLCVKYYFKQTEHVLLKKNNLANWQTTPHGSIRRLQDKRPKMVCQTQVYQT